MAGKLGMNVDLANQVAASISGHSSGLGLIEQQLYLARSMSLNPLNFALNPGALILAPASITMAASASADLANVRQTLDYLVLKLSQEATQQAQVSNSLDPTDAGWFAPGPTANRPDAIGVFENEWDAFGIFVNVGNYVLLGKDLLDVAGQAITKWWDNAPKWVTTGADIAMKGGKFLPFVGTAFSVTGVFTDWDDDNVWGNTRNIIGASLDVLSVVTLIPPLTPAAPVFAAAGLVWDVVDTVWDVFDDPWW